MTKFILDIDDKITPGFTNFKEANIRGIRNTLNTQAALTRRNAVKTIKQDFTLRNTFTVRQIQFDKTSETDISRMEAVIGATKRAAYMELQETGGQRPDSDGRTAIGQDDARIAGSGKKPVSKSLYMRRVGKKIVKGPFKKNLKTSRSKTVAAMFVAEKKKLFVKRNNNIYKVRSIFKSGNKVNANLTHIYNIQTGPIIIKSEPWLLPATFKPARDGANIYKSQMKKLWKDGDLI